MNAATYMTDQPNIIFPTQVTCNNTNRSLKKKNNEKSATLKLVIVLK